MLELSLLRRYVCKKADKTFEHIEDGGKSTGLNDSKVIVSFQTLKLKIPDWDKIV